MRVLDAEFVKGFMRMADDGWQQGWHENGRTEAGERVFPGDRFRQIFPECDH